MGLVALGLGIWYISKSLGGAAVGYASLDNFMTAIGAGGGNIANANGCFFCGYIQKLFAVIGDATEMFWTAMVSNIWILMVIGFGIFLFIHTANHIAENTAKIKNLDGSESKFEFKPWFDKVWKQARNIMIVGALLGAIGWGGTTALRTVANITITPVMFVGAELSMAATGVSDSAQCVVEQSDDVLNPVMQPFMCVMGNLNAVMLAGASGGFALMNYAWMDMGGGPITWVAGLALIIMFLLIGFDLFFQVLSVVFKLVFLIIFLPLILAAAAFADTWPLIANVSKNAITMLVNSAIKIVAITLKTFIIFAIVQYAADEYFPGPNDGYTSILPPLISQQSTEVSQQSLSIMNVFETCESVSMGDNGVDKKQFKNCFSAQRAMVERDHPGAFDFMNNGWEFLLLMIGIFLLYFYAVSPQIDKLISADKGGEPFDYGAWMKDIGKAIWDIPSKLTDAIGKAGGKNS